MKQILAALNAAMQEIGVVGKDGKNDFHGYKYASESDIIAAVRPVMVKHGLMLIPDVQSVDKDLSGNTDVMVHYTLYHTSGECLTFHMPGSGNDLAKSGKVGDKGVYKAITGAGKYATRGLFHLETRDDPERTSDFDRHGGYTEEPAPRKQPSPAPQAAAAADLGGLEEVLPFVLNAIKSCTPGEALGSFFRKNANQIRFIKERSKAAYAQVLTLLRDVIESHVKAAATEQALLEVLWQGVEPLLDDLKQVNEAEYKAVVEAFKARHGELVKKAA
jgi:hypothetical protein